MLCTNLFILCVVATPSSGVVWWPALLSSVTRVIANYWAFGKEVGGGRRSQQWLNRICLTPPNNNKKTVTYNDDDNDEDNNTTKMVKLKMLLIMMFVLLMMTSSRYLNFLVKLLSIFFSVGWSVCSVLKTERFNNLQIINMIYDIHKGVFYLNHFSFSHYNFTHVLLIIFYTFFTFLKLRSFYCFSFFTDVDI